MFNNVEGKIKGFAKFLGYFGVVVAIISLFLILSGILDDAKASLSYIGLAVLILVVPVELFGAYMLYGFGELIASNRETAANTAKKEN